MINTELLNSEDADCVWSIWREKHLEWIPEFWARFWDISKIQLDGDFELRDLEILVEIMTALKKAKR